MAFDYQQKVCNFVANKTRKISDSMATAKQTVYTALAIFDILCFLVLIAGILVHFNVFDSSDDDRDQISGPVPDNVIYTEDDFEEAEEVVFE